MSSAGNIHVVGSFSGIADFDPGGGAFTLASAGFADIFVSALDSAGSFVSAKRLGGSDNNDSGFGIAVDGTGNVHTAGAFSSTNADFDPSSGASLHSSAGGSDIFVSTLTAYVPSVHENEATNTVIGAFNTIDPEASDTHAFSLVTGIGDAGNSLFTVDGALLKTAATFDFETQPSYSIRVRATDSRPQSAKHDCGNPDANGRRRRNHCRGL